MTQMSTSRGQCRYLKGKFSEFSYLGYANHLVPSAGHASVNLPNDVFLITHLTVSEAWLCYDYVHYRDKKPELTGQFIHQWERMSRDFHMNLFQNLFL